MSEGNGAIWLKFLFPQKGIHNVDYKSGRKMEKVAWRSHVHVIAVHVPAFHIYWGNHGISNAIYVLLRKNMPVAPESEEVVHLVLVLWGVSGK